MKPTLTQEAKDAIIDALNSEYASARYSEEPEYLKGLTGAISIVESFPIYKPSKLESVFAYECGLSDGKAKMKELNRWIPVSERLPDDDVMVLVSDGTTIQVNCYSDLYEAFGFWKGSAEDEDDLNWIKNGNNVTHWQPLLLPPK